MRIFLLLLLISLQVSAQEMTLRKGVVIDSLKVNDTLPDSFALYLPLSFQEQRDLPVIFVFDREGRGKKAAQLFKPAAEQQDYIIVSSNDVRANRGLKENLHTAARLVNYVTSVLPLDFDQVSFAGFSEGADVATSLPLVFDRVHGVIAVGNHYLDYQQLQKGREFIFIGIVGDSQFTYRSMKMAAETLDLLNFPNEIYTFDGERQWPNPELISTAIATLTLQAMKQGKRAVDQRLVETLYEQDLSRINRIISNQRYVEALELLEQMESKYSGLRDISEIRDRRKQIQGARIYREQRRKAQEVTSKEEELINEYVYYMEEDIATANFENLGWWNFQRKQLDSLSQSDNRAEASMGTRVKGLLRELSRAKLQELQRTDGSLEQRLFTNMLITIFDQKAFEAYKNIISLSALDRDYNTALFYLEEMLKNGYDDKEALYNIEGTLGLRMTPHFNWLIRKYLGSARYHQEFELSE